MKPEEQLKVLNRGVAEIITEDELLKKLKDSVKFKKPLNIKYGADPSRPDLHLGHTVAIRKLKQFQDLGHQVIFIIGDFTARIGDPSGVSTTRPQLTEEEVNLNARTYAEQVFKILDKEKTKLVYNSSWFKKMDFEKCLKLASYYTVARMLERDDFHKRYQSGKPIGIHEFLYPLIQAYDSVVISADVELGGTDQKFNFLVARELQRAFNQSPQTVITLPLLEGLDGTEKMSKSLDNYIALQDKPQDMHGKIMSIPDNLILKYFLLLTDVPQKEIDDMQRLMEKGEVNPKDLKSKLGREIVKMYYNEEEADKVEREFEKVFKKKELPDEIPVFYVPASDLKDGKIWICNLLNKTSFVESKSSARRLIQQGAVEIDGQRILEVDHQIDLIQRKEIVIKVGKRRFGKIVLTP